MRYLPLIVLPLLLASGPAPGFATALPLNPSVAAPVRVATAPAESRTVFLVGTLRVTRLRLTPGAAPDTAEGALLVENRGSAPDRLLGATSDIAERSATEPASPDGKPGLVVPPGGSLTLAPKADAHLLLQGLRRPLTPAEEVSGTLMFERSGPLPVRFTVEGPQPTDE